MIRCAIVDLDKSVVVNVIDYATVPQGVPPGMTGNLIAVASDVASPGFIWDGTQVVVPVPPDSVYSPPE